MAVLTAVPIANLAVELLARRIVLPGTVSRVSELNFRGPSGGTATIRVPVPRTANVQSTPGAAITLNPIVETPVQITVTHIYDATQVTDEDVNLSIESFGRQILAPMVAAVATRAEAELGNLLNGRAPDQQLPADPTDLADEGYRRELEDAILQAGEVLDTNDVPAGDRFAAVSPSVARRLSRIDKFTRVDTTGRRDALSSASLGELHGFTFVKSNALNPGTAHFYHRSALAFGFLAPFVPGSVEGAQAESQGIALTWLRDYRTSNLDEIGVVHTYAGAALVDSDRIVSFNTAAG